jgi:hypothetical protein
MYTLGNEASTPMTPPPPEVMTKMDELLSDATKAGAMVATGGLAPTAQATRISYSDGDFTLVDGPFTETKELIGGWALMDVRDKEEAIEWAKRFLAIAGGGESTIRQVFGPDDLPPGMDPNAF